MAYEGVDQEILQDFIVEAGEYIENLSEQLVDLEKTPEDSELLNSIFRAYHTIKGGAGFLNLTNLVDICHACESVFDALRHGNQHVSPELMDTILKSYDIINDMYAHVQNQEPFDPAPKEIIDRLHALAQGGAPAAAAPAPAPKPAPKPAPAPEPAADAGDSDTITEDEFEKLLDQLHGQGVAPGADNDKARESDSTDGDFDKMISDLKNNGTTLPGGSPAAAPAAPAPSAPAQPADSGDMTDAEFEVLMDQIHGKGKGPGSEGDKAAVQSHAAPAAGSTGSLAAKDIQTAPKAAPAAAPAPETTVRVNTKVLDTIMNMVGELVLVRNRLVNINANKSDPEMNKAISNLDVVTADLQSAVMKTRMQPVKKVFGRFPRVVRDLARKLHKNIELKMVGEETDLDKNLVDALADPMVHMVRNSCDHGIEEPEVRARAGKPEVGTITLAASQQGDHILLTISDDGAGMDPTVLKQVAISRGVIDEETAQRMTDEEAFNLIFAPGFSTNKVVTDISGRGVGMDVVKTSIAKLNGSLKIDSKVGVGTTISIKVPLTLAILPTLMVQIGRQPFAIPLTSVSEIFSLELGKNVKVVDGQPTIVIREKAIALFYLEDWLIRSDERSHPDKGYVVIVQCGAQQAAYVVDGLIGQEEVVIKPLDNLLHKTPGLAGATITSDGGIALILDIPNLLKSYAHRH